MKKRIILRANPDKNEQMKNKLRNMMNPNRKGDSFLDGFRGDPFKQVH